MANQMELNDETPCRNCELMNIEHGLDGDIILEVAGQGKISG